jgi:hypothetical protein
VSLGPDAEVMGDVASVGGKLDRAPGAKIHGSVSETTGGVWPRGRWNHRDDGFDFGRPFGHMVSLSWALFTILVLGLLACLVLLLARQPFDRVDRVLATEFWKAGLVGLVAQVLFIPLVGVVSVILAISVVGCVFFLLYPFVALALLFFLLLGYAVSAHRLGRLLEARFNHRFGGVYAATLLGVVAIEVWSFLGHLLDLGGGILHVLAAIILLFGFAVRYVAWTAGLGAVILGRFGFPPKPGTPAAYAPVPVEPLVPASAPYPYGSATPGGPGWPEPPSHDDSAGPAL